MRRQSLNVGGVLFETTIQTLQPCRTITQNTGFIDHDPDIFQRVLRLLRGYPSHDLLHDEQVLYVLTDLQHEFLDVELPDWLHDCVKTLNDTMHTLDPTQSERYAGDTEYVLITTDALLKLQRSGAIQSAEQYEECRVVGIKTGWPECRWVPIKTWELAKTKTKFIKYFMSQGNLKE